MGVRIMRLNEKDKVVSVTKVLKEEEKEEEMQEGNSESTAITDEENN
jgi:hypothetical protein